MYNIEQISSIEDLQKHETLWQEFLSQHESPLIFQTPEWVKLWSKHFLEKLGAELSILMIWDSNKLVAIAPIMIRHKGFYKYATYLDNGFQDYRCLLIHNQANKIHILQAITDYLFKKGVGHLELRNELTDYQNSINQVKTILYNEESAPYLLRVSSFDDLLTQLRPSFVKNLKRKLKRAQKAELDFVYDTKSKSDSDQLVDKLVEIHIKRRTEKGTKSLLSEAGHIQFLKEFSKLATQKGWLSIDTVSINKEIAAIFYGYEYSQKKYYYLPAIDSKYYTYSPGILLLERVLSQLHEHTDIAEFDFMAGEDPYKYLWTSTDRKLYTQYFINQKHGLWFICWLFLKTYLTLRWLKKQWAQRKISSGV